MPLPALEVSSSPLSAVRADAAILILPEWGDDPTILGAFAPLAETLAVIGFTGASSAFARISAPEVFSGPLAVVGVGHAPDEHRVREAAGTALRQLTGFGTVALALAEGLLPHATAAAEGALLGGYRFEGYRTEHASSPPQTRAERVALLADLGQDELQRVQSIGDAVALVKDLISVPAEWLGPDDVATRARTSVENLDVSVDVYDQDALREAGFGGILGVGQGSARPPRLVRLEYAPQDARRHLALVGKGITFDTGGLSLKPPASMVGMKYDMAGAATVLAVLRAAAARALPVRITAWLALAENMPSGSAIRPGDVVRMGNGATVEVLNTDAEGRLVLGDALVAASRDQPDLLIDVATLTGAVIVALGARHTGVFGDDEAVAELLDAARIAGENAWALPLPVHMEEEVSSPIADLANAKIGDTSGGASFAAVFLRRFIGRRGDTEDSPQIPWVHLDIAGSGSHSGAPYGFTDKGPTAAMVRTLLTLIESSTVEEEAS